MKIIFPIDFHIFQRGRSTTNQIWFALAFLDRMIRMGPEVGWMGWTWRHHHSVVSQSGRKGGQMHNKCKTWLLWGFEDCENACEWLLIIYIYIIISYHINELLFSINIYCAMHEYPCLRIPDNCYIVIHVVWSHRPQASGFLRTNDGVDLFAQSNWFLNLGLELGAGERFHIFKDRLKSWTTKAAGGGCLVGVKMLRRWWL